MLKIYDLFLVFVVVVLEESPSVAELADEREECGEEPATSILHIDGVSTFVCETCLDWWSNHTALPPNTRSGAQS